MNTAKNELGMRVIFRVSHSLAPSPELVPRTSSPIKGEEGVELRDEPPDFEEDPLDLDDGPPDFEDDLFGLEDTLPTLKE